VSVLVCSIGTGGTARAWATAVSGREPSSGYEDPRLEGWVSDYTMVAAVKEFRTGPSVGVIAIPNPDYDRRRWRCCSEAFEMSSARPTPAFMPGSSFIRQDDRSEKTYGVAAA